MRSKDALLDAAEDVVSWAELYWKHTAERRDEYVEICPTALRKLRRVVKQRKQRLDDAAREGGEKE